MLNQACLITRNLIRDPTLLQFVCHTAAGWSAASSEAALDQAGTGNLDMVHLGWLLKTPLAFPGMVALPERFAMDLVDHTWRIRYFYFGDEDPSDWEEPEEGAFLAPPLGHPLLALQGDDFIHVFVKPLDATQNAGAYEVETVTLDEGTECVPFWRKAAEATIFEEYVSDEHRLQRMTYQELCERARAARLSFLAADFLTMPHDYALLVDP